MYLIEEKIIFIHIPKNYGSTIRQNSKNIIGFKLIDKISSEQTLQTFEFTKKGGGHKNVNGINLSKLEDINKKEINPWKNKDYKFFCLFRDVIERFISQFYYRMKTKSNIECQYYNNINYFVSHIFNYDFIKNKDVYFPQYLWIISNNEIKMDYILLDKYFKKDVMFLNKKYSSNNKENYLINNTNKKINNTDNYEKEELNEESKKKILDIYKIDYILYCSGCNDINPEERCKIIKDAYSNLNKF